MDSMDSTIVLVCDIFVIDFVIDIIIVLKNNFNFLKINKYMEMESIEFIEPKSGEYTIYSKSVCPNCSKVKALLNEKEITFSLIDCDEYLLECKQEFLLFIKSIIASNIECKMFPMVFDNKYFIGGFKETKEHLEKTLIFDNDDF